MPSDMSGERPNPPINAGQRAYPAYPFVGVSLAVFRAGHVLVATRTKPPFEGAFSLPGGLVEIGESLEAAALRELAEEVEVKARIIGFNQHVESIDRDPGGRVRHHYVIASFVGEWISGEGTPGPEAGEIRWVRPQDLVDLKCTPLVVPVVEAAAKLVKAPL